MFRKTTAFTASRVMRLYFYRKHCAAAGFIPLRAPEADTGKKACVRDKPVGKGRPDKPRRPKRSPEALRSVTFCLRPAKQGCPERFYGRDGRHPPTTEFPFPLPPSSFFTAPFFLSCSPGATGVPLFTLLLLPASRYKATLHLHNRLIFRILIRKMHLRR